MQKDLQFATLIQTLLTSRHQMWSLGNSGAHVLDAISQCEEEMRRQGRLEKDTPWSLSLRKELFTPWHESKLDEVSTDLIYRQIIKGIKAGEYVADKVRLFLFS